MHVLQGHIHSSAYHLSLSQMGNERQKNWGAIGAVLNETEMGKKLPLMTMR